MSKDSQADGAPPVARLPGGPDPAEPIPRTPVSGVDLERYAQIAAELAEQPRARNEVLARHELNELRWLEIEKTWLLRVATGALAGDPSLGQAIDQAFIAAQDAVGGGEPARPLADYARIVARLESGEALTPTLAAEGLSLADWSRLSRAWSGRIAADPEVARAYEAARVAARA
ncbi:MAG: hypothetical protein R3B72_50380 [Polyangiaceae bacterium]